MWYPLERGIATRFSMLAWRIPWTEEPAGLQSMGSQRVGHGWSDWARTPQQTLMRPTRKEKLTVAILKGAHGWESSLPNRVEGLQPLETASSTRGSHQHPRAEAHTSAWEQGEGKAPMIRHRKVNLASELAVIQKPAATQEAQSALVAWQGAVDSEWHCQPRKRLATTTEKQRMCLSEGRRAQRTRPFSRKAAASTSSNRNSRKVQPLSDFMKH